MSVRCVLFVCVCFCVLVFDVRVCARASKLNRIIHLFRVKLTPFAVCFHRHWKVRPFV